MKVLHGADIHADLRRFSPPGRPYQRVEDMERTMTRFAELVEEHKPDLAVWAGDTFQTRRPDPRAQRAVARVALRIAATCDLVITPGNHDGPDVVGDPATHTLGWLDAVGIPRVHVLLRPATLTLTRAGVNVVAVPYPHKRGLDLWLPENSRARARERDAAAILRDGIAALRDSIPGRDARDFRTIFVGHLTVAGSRLGSERAMALGWSVTVDADTFEDFDYAALGHVHRQQAVTRKAYYAGAPEHIDFGEAGQPKGFLLAEVVRGLDPVVTPLPSNPRPMVVVHLIGDSPQDGPGIPEGAMVRIVVEAERQPTARERSRFARWAYAQGASFVKVDPVVTRPPERQRAVLAADTSVEEALRRYWTLRGEDPEPYVDAARPLLTA